MAMTGKLLFQPSGFEDKSILRGGVWTVWLRELEPSVPFVKASLRYICYLSLKNYFLGENLAITNSMPIPTKI